MKNASQASAIAAVIRRAVPELEADIKTNIRDSRPAGRTYRRTAIVRKGNRNNSSLQLRERNGKKIVGFNFHRASAPGQPPAIDTGRLINSIRGQIVGQLHGRLTVGAAYGVVLDDPQGLNRPFFFSRVNLYRPIFFENIRKAFIGR